MSKRTAEANRAVKEAWERERLLVLEGKGTRNWTEEQQRSIIDLGKAYGDDGKAFEGHHMKSAEKYPKFQGDANNIQFLTRDEHRLAHGGNFRNPTNGRYNPERHSTQVFGEEPCKPCAVIPLSNPVAAEGFSCDLSIQPAVSSKTEMSEVPTNLESLGNDCRADPPRQSCESDGKTLQRFGRNVADKFCELANSVKEFSERHPYAAGAAILLATSAAQAYVVRSRVRGGGNDASIISTDSEDLDVFPGNDMDLMSSSTRRYPEERTSPQCHSVSGYDRIRYGKVEHVRSYRRGGEKSE